MDRDQAGGSELESWNISDRSPRHVLTSLTIYIFPRSTGVRRSDSQMLLKTRRLGSAAGRGGFYEWAFVVYTSRPALDTGSTGNRFGHGRRPEKMLKALISFRILNRLWIDG